MIYSVLAKYYDGLVKDNEATQAWVKLITKYLKKKDVLELACGSGEITLALSALGYKIDASDLSHDMIEEAKSKDDKHLINFFEMDMNNINTKRQYDGILCLCDSINYLTSKEQIKKLVTSVYQHLNDDGYFIFDMHSMDRLSEFQEEFFEEGIVNEHEYTWSIISEDDKIYHNFCFYDENANMTQEQHIQKVYSPEFIANCLNPYFTFEIKTDFNLDGIQTGEKYFYICRKRG